jgi:hypothetical protein
MFEDDLARSEHTEEMDRDRKSAKCCAISFSIIYLMLFLPFFYMGMLSSMAFDNPIMTAPVGIVIMLLTFSISFSMPISIYLMWSRYLCGQYKKTRIFCAIPPLTFVFASIVIETLRALLRYFVPL